MSTSYAIVVSSQAALWRGDTIEEAMTAWAALPDPDLTVTAGDNLDLRGDVAVLNPGDLNGVIKSQQIWRPVGLHGDPRTFWILDHAIEIVSPHDVQAPPADDGSSAWPWFLLGLVVVVFIAAREG